MRLSDILAERVKDRWEEAARKPFLKEMALGTLSRSRYHVYMLQDFLYLQDYIRILRRMTECTQDPGLVDFLHHIIEETERETWRVHVPEMRKAGVSDEEADNAVRMPVIVEYVDYMLRVLETEGSVAGLAALLQCSWVYAFIGDRMMEEYAAQISGSPFRSWFEAYTCAEYTKANQEWIDMLDSRTAGIDKEQTEKLCCIFENCAAYENRLWDEL